MRLYYLGNTVYRSLTQAATDAYGSPDVLRVCEAGMGVPWTERELDRIIFIGQALNRATRKAAQLNLANVGIEDAVKVLKGESES